VGQGPLLVASAGASLAQAGHALAGIVALMLAAPRV
jgi:hypothetical protein